MVFSQGPAKGAATRPCSKLRKTVTTGLFCFLLFGGMGFFSKMIRWLLVWAGLVLVGGESEFIDLRLVLNDWLFQRLGMQRVQGTEATSQ